MDTFFLLWSVFHFCLELALETLAKVSLTHFLWVHDPLISELYPLWPLNAPPHQKLPTHLGMVPLQGERSGSTPIWVNNMRNGPASADQGYSTARQGSQDLLNMPAHLPLSHLPHPTFFAIAKPVFKTDCANCEHADKVRWCQNVSSVIKGLTSILWGPSQHLAYW